MTTLPAIITDVESRPNLPAHRGDHPGQVIVHPGDPRYCWNPYRHDPHDFRYTLDDGTTGAIGCDGDPAFLGRARLVASPDWAGLARHLRVLHVEIDQWCVRASVAPIYGDYGCSTCRTLLPREDPRP